MQFTAFIDTFTIISELSSSLTKTVIYNQIPSDKKQRNYSFIDTKKKKCYQTIFQIKEIKIGWKYKNLDCVPFDQVYCHNKHCIMAFGFYFQMQKLAICTFAPTTVYCSQSSKYFNAVFPVNMNLFKYRYPFVFTELKNLFYCEKVVWEKFQN